MNPFYKLNETLANIAKDTQQVAESKKPEVKTPARKTLEESLRSDMKSLMEGTKPDFLDMDKDGNKKEPMKKAVGDKKKNPFAKKEEKVKEDASAGMAQGNTLEDMDESAFQAYLGKQKYGKAGMKALQQAGRDGAGKEKMAKIRSQHDKMDESEKADKDYDKDGKVESPKAEYMGARIAAGKRAAAKMKEQISPDAEMAEAGLPDVADKRAKMAQARGEKPHPLKNVGKGIKAFFKGEPEPMDEEQEGRPYVVVHARKGQAEVYANSSYEAAKKAAAKWGLKNTAGVDAYLADVTHTAVDEEQEMLNFLQSKLGTAKAKPYNRGTGRPDAHNGMEFEGEEMTLEAVSRKHFQQIADLLKAIEDPIKRKEMAMHHAQIFAQQNPRFDIQRFGQAAGVDLSECGMWESLKGGQKKLDVDGDGDIGSDDLADLRAGHEVDEGFGEMDAWLKQREAEKGTGKFDKRKVSTGTVYTRKPETFGDEPTAAPDANAPKRGRGRPKKMAEDGCCPHCGGPITPEGELDEEAVEAGKRHFFDKLAPAAKKAAKIVKKVTGGRKEVDEESTEKKDSKAEKAGKKVAKDIEHDEGNKAKGDNKAEKAGKKVTKDIEYDDKKDKKEKKADKKEGNPFAKKDGDKKDKEEKVEETTTAGSVATATRSGKSSSGVGTGIYDSWNRQFETLINESVNISTESAKMEDGNEEESITINVTGDDVARFKEVLASMGLGQQGPADAVSVDSHDDSCGTCGGTPCQCDDQMGSGEVMGLPGEVEIEVVEADAPVDQNSPDYPTNQEYDNDALQYSGGLNGPKSTGQSTVPVLASQEERRVAEGSDQRFFSLVKSMIVK